MKKYRSSVGQRIYPVEYSSMTGNTVPHILNSFIPFDGGDDYVSRESGNGNKSAYQKNVTPPNAPAHSPIRGLGLYRP